MSRADLTQVRQAVSRGSTVAEAVREHRPELVGVRGLLTAAAEASAELDGAGPVLQPLLADPAVTDVLVNDTRVWVDRGRGLQEVPARLGSSHDVRALATRMAALCGQRLDDASPVVDGTLPDGTRLHAVLPPVSASGVLICLRTQRPHVLTLTDLVRAGTVADDLAPVLEALVHARANVLVSGATGSGKTTLLASMLSLVPTDERIVCLEEAAELRPDHPHVVHLQVRHANVQRAGAVPMADLVRAAMRMRPDRLVLGECRGAEVREVLGALNTGHDGGWATVHANTSTDVPARLVALGALAGMSDRTVAAQAVSALDAVLHLRRDHGSRRLVQVAVLHRDGSDLRCHVALEVDDHGKVRATDAWPELAARLGWPARAGAAPRARHAAS